MIYLNAVFFSPAKPIQWYKTDDRILSDQHNVPHHALLTGNLSRVLPPAKAPPPHDSMWMVGKRNSPLLTCDGDIRPGLLLPPQRNKHSDISVASIQEEVHSELDSQTREHFLVPMTEWMNGSQRNQWENVKTTSQQLSKCLRPVWNDDSRNMHV